MENIQFINHASVLISDDHDAILTDPWYNGSIFNKGWNLLYEQTDKDIEEVLSHVSYIWISHEHPDHFSPAFFIKFKKNIIDKKIKILFQHTKDKRVIGFLNSKGFDVVEIKNNKRFIINPNFSIRIQNVDFYDSSLIINIGNKTIINTNDCPFENEKELNKFAKTYGPADILLTQFSYAAWKGGKENIEWRANAAREKLVKMEKQANALKCKKIIPFASFVYFSNQENKYLNDKMNTPKDLDIFFRDKDQQIIFMKPLEQQVLDNLFPAKESFNFWEDKMKNIFQLPYFEYENKIDFNELCKKFEKYRNRIFDKNSFLLIKLISLVPFVGAFRDIKLYLTDQDIVINVSIFTGLSVSDQKQFDVKMHSESFAFILENEFGFDTLTVNGNFECQQSGFSKTAKLMSIGSLNAMGINISFSFIFRPDIYLLFIEKLFKVQKNILAE